jgi:hypothetical protein
MSGSFTTKMERKWKLELLNIVGISFAPTNFALTNPPQPTIGQWQWQSPGWLQRQWM